MFVPVSTHRGACIWRGDDEIAGLIGCLHPTYENEQKEREREKKR
jgi:signal transduction histidine kinase